MSATSTPSSKAAADARKAQQAENKSGNGRKASTGAATPPKGGRPAADATKAQTRSTTNKGEQGTRQNPNRPAPAKIGKAEVVSEIKGEDLQGWLADFVKTNGTTDTDAPEKGNPFVQKGRLYVKAIPLLEHIASKFGYAPTPRTLASALVELKFERQPFPVRVGGKQTAASHYSAPVGKLPKPVKDELPDERVTARAAAKAEKEETTS